MTIMEQVIASSLLHELLRQKKMINFSWHPIEFVMTVVMMPGHVREL